MVLGDKEHPEVYAIYNEGEGSCVVDLVEVGMGAGGHDHCIEHKVWGDLYKFDRAAGSPDCTLDGATHAFGNTEAHAIRSNLGVGARAGEQRWCTRTGTGRVEAPPPHKVAYHDAIHNKKNTVTLSLYNLFGGAAPGASRRIAALSKRETDRTEYESWAAAAFVPYWTQRISAEIVVADARRCLKRLPGLKLRASAAPTTGRAHARPRPNGPTPGRRA